MGGGVRASLGGGGVGGASLAEVTNKNIVVGCVAGNSNNSVEIGTNKDVVVDVGGGILDWEDEYGVIESYPSVTGASPVGGGVGAGASHSGGGVEPDVGLVSCDQRFYWEIVDDHHVDSSDEELPPHGLVDSLSEEEVDKKRLTPQKMKSRKASFAIARALQPAHAVMEIAKLTEGINELDDDSRGAVVWPEPARRQCWSEPEQRQFWREPARRQL